MLHLFINIAFITLVLKILITARHYHLIRALLRFLLLTRQQITLIFSSSGGILVARRPARSRRILLRDAQLRAESDHFLDDGRPPVCMVLLEQQVMLMHDLVMLLWVHYHRTTPAIIFDTVLDMPVAVLIHGWIQLYGCCSSYKWLMLIDGSGDDV